jgi:hypothetical protein
MDEAVISQLGSSNVLVPTDKAFLSFVTAIGGANTDPLAMVMTHPNNFKQVSVVLSGHNCRKPLSTAATVARNPGYAVTTGLRIRQPPCHRNHFSYCRLFCTTLLVQ